jgi:hypothetical protein
MIIVILGLLFFSREKKGWGTWVFGLVLLFIHAFVSLCVFARLFARLCSSFQNCGHFKWSNMI